MYAPSPIPIWSPFAHYRELREVHKAYNCRLNPAAGGKRLPNPHVGLSPAAA